ncbi:murein hydrolase activator EnvC family protein [Salisediminibacterium beveridgei]|uniref:Peptidoglycan DL-endopeptidase CwlO n=1 Tax=Salisediminibacterium beveridgei TaxID=632773 RepID=A0A1D7QSJ0_9BACI|nr:peptidoglycan DD-metalloendopeptidase family protein [Salisediminibacterium beveridgei]AOM81949.1 Peptidoglycan DL-endopeptidase CwlO [Salisediminibacterium beveridgei]
MSRVFSLPLFLLIFVLVLTAVFSSVHANEGEELEEEIEGLEEEREETLEEQQEREAELEEVQSEMSDVEAELQRLDDEMASTNRQIDAKQEEIDLTMDRVADLEEQIRELEERISDRDELLKERVRQMYQNGGSINYIEVILGAQNFGDLIERISALNSIAQQDQNILDEHVADMEAVEIAKEDLESELAFLEEQMTDLETLRANLEAQSAEKDGYLEELADMGYVLEEELISLDEKEEFLIAQTQAAEQELAEWEKAEEERRRKEAEEQRRKEEEAARRAAEQAAAEEAAAEEAAAEAARQAAAEEAAAEEAAQESSSNNQTDSSNSGGNSAPAASGGIFHRPADGRVTSHFGMRTHPVHGGQRLHAGTDFGRDGGRNIYAAESGTVISSGWFGGYGNTITVSHVVNGSSVTTLYAHLSGSNVSKGQRVSRGQVIGTMGTTGTSTGVHLHFEVHPGGYSGSSSAVNPMGYLN